MNQPCQRFTGEPQSSPKPRLAEAAKGIRGERIFDWLDQHIPA